MSVSKAPRTAVSKAEAFLGCNIATVLRFAIGDGSVWAHVLGVESGNYY